VSAIRFLIENPNARGAFNLTAPQPVTNAQLAKTLGRVMRRPSFFPTPGFLLRLVLGEKATIVLDGQRPIPKRLTDMGFRFQFPELEAALRDTLSKKRK
jgi:NAD dependent epimerase/dehydratase family enzyme